MMMVVTEVIQVVHRLVPGWGCRMVPVVRVMLRMVQQVMIVMVPDQHRGGGSLR